MDERIDTLDELFIHELQDLYSAEQQLTAALPKMASAADRPELRESLARHLDQTQQHLERIERALRLVDQKPNGEVCGPAGVIVISEPPTGDRWSNALLSDLGLTLQRQPGVAVFHVKHDG